MYLFKMNQINLKKFIIYIFIIWLIQFDLVTKTRADNLTSISSNNSAPINKKSTKPIKLKNNKLNKKTTFNKLISSFNKNVTTSLSPAKLEDSTDNLPKTLYQISRDGRHQMLAFGSEITLALQTEQLVFEQNLA